MSPPPSRSGPRPWCGVLAARSPGAPGLGYHRAPPAPYLRASGGRDAGRPSDRASGRHRRGRLSPRSARSHGVLRLVRPLVRLEDRSPPERRTVVVRSLHGHGVAVRVISTTPSSARVREHRLIIRSASVHSNVVLDRSTLRILYARARDECALRIFMFFRDATLLIILLLSYLRVTTSLDEVDVTFERFTRSSCNSQFWFRITIIANKTTDKYAGPCSGQGKRA